MLSRNPLKAPIAGEQQMLDITKKYQTREGYPVRILAWDGPGQYPIIGIVEVDVGNKESRLETWTTDGYCYNGLPGSVDDLVPIIQVRVVYRNLYPSTNFMSPNFKTVDAAKASISGSHSYDGTIELTFHDNKLHEVKLV